MHSSTSRFLPRALIALALFATAARAQIPSWAKTTPADAAAAGIGVQLTGADYGNSTFVLTAYFTTGPVTAQVNTPAAYTSADGVTWTRRTLPGTNAVPYAPRFLNGKFFVAIQPGNAGNGVIASSADGVTWATSSLGASVNAPSDLAFGNGVYVGSIASPIPGANQVVTSTDGATWTARSITANSNGGHVVFFNGKFYATVTNFSVANGSGIYSSADGVAWTKINGGPANPNQLAAGTSTLLATFFSGSSNGQSLSSDGSTFTTASPGLPLSGGTIRYLNGAFVSAARSGATSFDDNLVSASLDGRTWSTIATTVNAFGSSEVAYGNGRYVFVGEFDVFSGTSTITPGGTAGGGGSTGGGTSAPAVTAHPVAQSVSAGGSVTFTVTVTGTGVTYQWFFNGVAIAGATSASYTIAAVTAGNAGSYSVAITNGGGTTTSNAAALTVAPAGSAGAYLSNLSIRSNAGSGPQTLIVGVTVGGTGTKNMLIRGIGPALAAFGLTTALGDPKLDVFSSANSTTPIATNDNWDATATPLTTQVGAGAFPLTAGSRDAALLGAVPAGGYSVQLTGVGGTTGIALAELYDLTPAANFTSSTPRLINISARTQVGTGGDILITGFNVSGTGQRRLIIRAVGPTLSAFGLTGTLADPKLDVFSGSTVIASNDNWDATATPLATQTGVGAFPLAPGTKDAVLIVNLAPGSYTAQVSGVGGTTGVALVEIYELP